jgi:hypothetical protein
MEFSMKPIRTAFASFAAAGLLLAQPAAAANARTGSAVGDSENLAGVSSAAWPAVIGILLVAIAAIVSSAKDGDEDFPVSP